MLNPDFMRRKRDIARFPRAVPEGVRVTSRAIAFHARVPSYAEWAHRWQLDHGRPPTNREIDVHFVNCDAWDEW